ncbi:hypothetical protein Y032_0011g1467 [Ancylostoma ceylanicum]|uniref:Uncharacterized protein n=1 Tax=Ancylostoma ceylanicum TaxID=53326 RepID=A0A016VFY3_9BILA|nr:hypothetical protein Y032_0011g1467 [Ancylostoma ceylanicum]
MYYGIDAVRVETAGRDGLPECANQSRLATPIFPHDDTIGSLCPMHQNFYYGKILDVFLDSHMNFLFHGCLVHLVRSSATHQETFTSVLGGGKY